MGWKKYIRNGIGLLGKAGMGVADHLSFGLASKVKNTVSNIADKHSGLIGNVMNTVGKWTMSDGARSALSKATDAAIQFMPKGKVRTAMEKINNHAQGRDVNYNVKTGKVNTPKSEVTTPQFETTKEPIKTGRTPRKYDSHMI